MTRNIKVQKSTKKIQKIKKYDNGFISCENRFEKTEKEKKIKNIIPFRSSPTRHRKLPKNSKKIEEIKKNTIMAPFHAKIGWKRQRKRKNKIYPSVSFLPDPKYKIQKKQEKNSKN